MSVPGSSPNTLDPQHSASLQKWLDSEANQPNRRCILVTCCTRVLSVIDWAYTWVPFGRVFSPARAQQGA